MKRETKPEKQMYTLFCPKPLVLNGEWQRLEPLVSAKRPAERRTAPATELFVPRYQWKKFQKMCPKCRNRRHAAPSAHRGCAPVLHMLPPATCLTLCSPCHCGPQWGPVIPGVTAAPASPLNPEDLGFESELGLRQNRLDPLHILSLILTQAGVTFHTRPQGP